MRARECPATRLELNAQQRAAVHYVNGPLLVLAGAGSGKTSVLTHKVAALIKEYDLSARHIVAVTFTNKAAREMKTRLSDMLNGDSARDLTVSTFHAFGLKILRAHLKGIGYRPGFSIYDPEDSRALLTKLLRGVADDSAGFADKVRWQISRWKNALVTPGEAPVATGEAVSDAAARVYGEYERHMQAYNAMDLDDLTLKPVRLFQQQVSVLKEWRKRVQYLLVDEYQDTNPCQYELVKRLADESGALTVVGDDDQSICGWRGGQPQNLAQLQCDFPSLKVIKLEQNYRSTARILKAANAVIAHNTHVFPKELWGQGGFGDALRVLKSRSEEHEAERVVADIMYHKFKHSTEYRDYAILYRENHQSRALERALREQRIPYFLTGGTSFFDKTEIKDVMAYLRLLTNPDDDNAFLRVVNTPRREIGPATLETLARHAAELGTSLLTASLDAGLAGQLGAPQLAALRQFTEWLTETVRRAEKEEPVKVVCNLLADIRYEDWLKDTCNDHKIAARSLENTLKLVTSLQRLSRGDGEALPFADIVARLTLTGLLDRESEDNPGDCVALMTLHATKGLEFPHVYILGMEEGLLPHHQSLAAGDVEEERRLAYVGMTRARATLTFAYAGRRRRGGEIIACEPSRFLQEIPPNDLHWEDSDAEFSHEATLGRAEVYLASLRTMRGTR